MDLTGELRAKKNLLKARRDSRTMPLDCLRLIVNDNNIKWEYNKLKIM